MRVPYEDLVFSVLWSTLHLRGGEGEKEEALRGAVPIKLPPPPIHPTRDSWWEVGVNKKRRFLLP